MESPYDVIIVGAGPAGMTAAIYAARKLLKTLILAPFIGGKAIYASEVDNYLGFRGTPGYELASKFQDHLKDYPVDLRYDTVKSIEKKEGLFEVMPEHGSTFQGYTVIFATGTSDRKLGLEGEEKLTGKGVAYCATCDAPFFRDLPVMVAGGGNAAVTAALQLAELCPKVYLLFRSADLQADEIYQHELLLWPNIDVLRQSQLKALQGEEQLEGVRVLNLLTEEETDLEVRGLFVEIGLVPNSDPVRHLVQLNEKGEVLTDRSCRTSVPGLFAAGDVTAEVQKQIIIAAGEGAKAALSVYQYLRETTPRK